MPLSNTEAYDVHRLTQVLIPEPPSEVTTSDDGPIFDDGSPGTNMLEQTTLDCLRRVKGVQMDYWRCGEARNKPSPPVVSPTSLSSEVPPTTIEPDPTIPQSVVIVSTTNRSSCFRVMV